MIEPRNDLYFIYYQYGVADGLSDKSKKLFDSFGKSENERQIIQDCYDVGYAMGDCLRWGWYNQHVIRTNK